MFVLLEKGCSDLQRGTGFLQISTIEVLIYQRFHLSRKQNGVV